MSLSSKALDRLLARVVDRLAHAVPVKDLPLPVGLDDIDAALDRAAEKVTKERFASYLDAGNFDHRVNDTIDCEVGNKLNARELMDEAKDKLESIVEDKLDTAGFGRQVDRAVENPDLEELVNSKVDELDVEGYLKEAAQEVAEREADLVLEAACNERLGAAFARRYNTVVVESAIDRAAAEVISTAVCRLEDAANAALEQES